MIKLSVDEIIKKINSDDLFYAVASDYSFTLKIESYVPYICGAVHDGHQFRRELWENCIHTDYERWYEEDPETKNMVISHPMGWMIRPDSWCRPGLSWIATSALSTMWI